MIKSKELILICVFFFFVILSSSKYIDDDACISYRFVRNLLEGYGLVPYIDGPRLEGYSNPFLVFATSIIAYIIKTTDYFTIIRIGLFLNTVSALGIIVFLFYWRESNKFWYTPAFLLALFKPFQAGRASGLETSLYTFFITASIYFFSQKKYRYGMVTLFFLSLTRPEGIGISLALLLVFIFESYKDHKELIKRFYSAIKLIALPYGTFLAWRFWYFGNLLSNTSYAKTHLISRGVFQGSGIIYMLEGLGYAPILLIFFIFTVFRLYEKKFEYRYETAVIIAQTMFIIAVGGDYKHFGPYRFLIPILPILFRSSSYLLDKLQRIPLVYALFLVVFLCPEYNQNDRAWFCFWGEEIYETISNPQSINTKIHSFINPKPWSDYLFSQYLARNVINSGKGYSLSSCQGGSLLLDWKGTFQDIEGLLSYDYAQIPPNQREEVFRNNLPDVFTIYASKTLTLEGTFQIEHQMFPSARILIELGYYPRFIFEIKREPLNWYGQIYKNWQSFIFIVFTRNPTLINLENITHYEFYKYEDSSAKIEAFIPVIEVLS